MLDADLQKLSAAHHQSGHAVAAIALRSRFAEVALRMGPEASLDVGLEWEHWVCEAERAACLPDPQAAHGSWPSTVRKRAICLLAGPAALYWLACELEHPDITITIAASCRGDIPAVERLARAQGLEDDLVTRYMEDTTSRAIALLGDHRVAVTQVAGGLLATGKLAARDVRRIVETAAGRRF